MPGAERVVRRPVARAFVRWVQRTSEAGQGGGVACGLLQAGEVGVGVGGGAGALGGVQRFGKGFEGDVQGIVAVHAGGETVRGGANAGGLVDAELFFNGQMQVVC